MLPGMSKITSRTNVAAEFGSRWCPSATSLSFHLRLARGDGRANDISAEDLAAGGATATRSGAGCSGSSGDGSASTGRRPRPGSRNT